MKEIKKNPVDQLFFYEQPKTKLHLYSIEYFCQINNIKQNIFLPYY